MPWSLCGSTRQVELAPEACPKTAFGQGLWQFKVMPFGLCNMPATFEHLMDRVLADIDLVGAGHFGVTKTLRWLWVWFYWLGCCQELELYMSTGVMPASLGRGQPAACVRGYPRPLSHH